METQILKKYETAGRIWRKAINHAEKKAKKGTPLLELAQGIEKLVKEEGAEPAFPVNLSINEQAAHYTPKWKDEYALKESDVLKIDIGVSIEGYICDGAITINLDNTHAKQIEANELALQNAISAASFGKSIEKIGAEIERTLKEKGFNPVYNLGGHGLDKNDIHAYPSIPNHAKGSSADLKEGVIAIEPFASTGKGNVTEAQDVEIFSLEKTFGVRNPTARKLLEILKDFNELPFAERWLREKAIKLDLEDFQVTLGLKELMKSQCLHSYPGLKENKNVIVTQTEKSLIILEDKVIEL